MTNEQIKLIYEYMEWKINKQSPSPHLYQVTPYSKILDSNSAWEVVQEMEKKRDWSKFFVVAFNCFKDVRNFEFTLWLINPDNFFECMAKWLEGKGK
jgi:hypothetical protein